jgi:hypothetical protein
VRLVDNSLLLRKVADVKSVCVIGCPHCTNQSIGFAKDMSIIGKHRLGGFAYDAYAVTNEANHLRELLTAKGIGAKVKVFGRLDSAPCQMHERERRIVARACENTDAAITLCCNSGWEGIRTALPESFKVVQGMATLGTISAYLETEKGKDVLNKEKTKIMSFRELKQTI